MNAKKPMTIEAAAKQLDDAIAANRADIADDIRSVRGRLEKLVELVGPKALGNEVQQEISLLTSLFADDDQQLLDGSQKRRVTTKEKIAFLKRHLSKTKNGMQKTELLELAGKEFGNRPAPTFLDPALKSKDFKTEGKGKGSPVVVYLV